MKTRYLQEDGRSVVWHDADGTRAMIWNFAELSVSLPDLVGGTVTDLTAGQQLAKSPRYGLQPRRVYSVTGGLRPAELPVAIDES